MADVGCRNTIFGAEAQTDPKSLQSWVDAEIANFRLEFVHQSPEQVKEITVAFAKFFGGSFSAGELAEAIEASSPQSTTKGSLFVPGNFKHLVQLK